jgi:AraC family transcriptional regulator
LLGDRALTLVEVAQSSGFADQQHLIRTFRRVTGVTPGVYRRG